MSWLARILGPADFALFGSTLNASLIALVVMEGGWSALMYRELSHTPPKPFTDQLPSAALAYALALFFPCWLAMVVFSSSVALAVAATACMFAVALMNQRSARLRAASDFSGEALWQLTGRASSALAIVAMLALWPSLPSSGETGATGVFSAWALGLTVCLVLTLPRWWSMPSWVAVKSFYPMAAAVLLVELGVAVVGKGDLVVLFAARKGLGLEIDALSGGDALVGFTASTRLVEAVLLGVAPLGNVVIAYMRLPTANSVAAPHREVLQAAFCFGLLGCALWGVAWLNSEQIFAIVFGEAFVSGASWLKWASLPLPWMMANLLLLQAALAVVPLHRIAYAALGCAINFVVIATLMLPFFGAISAAIAAALSQAVLTLCLTRDLLRHSAPTVVADT
jgi:O-antigen/teichoic acid export membrane protein